MQDLGIEDHQPHPFYPGITRVLHVWCAGGFLSGANGMDGWVGSVGQDLTFGTFGQKYLPGLETLMASMFILVMPFVTGWWFEENGSWWVCFKRSTFHSSKDLDLAVAIRCCHSLPLSLLLTASE